MPLALALLKSRLSGASLPRFVLEKRTLINVCPDCGKQYQSICELVNYIEIEMTKRLECYDWSYFCGNDDVVTCQLSVTLTCFMPLRRDVLLCVS